MAKQKEPGGKEADRDIKDLAGLAKAGSAFEAAVAGDIREKMQAGLTREQAIEVMRQQVAEDASRAGGAAQP